MNFIVVLSSVEDLNDEISGIIDTKFPNRFLLQYPSTEQEALELLNFEFPEIVIVNFSDPKLDLDFLNTQIQKDSWLHNFGIIGVYDKNKDNESEIIERYRNVNLLTLLEKNRLQNQLAKTLQIIYRNRQFIYQGWLSEKLINHVSGSFTIKNIDFMVVPVYTGLLVTSMIRMGWRQKEERHDLQMALSELVINGIEHGNCGITFQEKTEYLMKGYGIPELILEKNKNPQIAKRNVRLDWDYGDKEIKFTITDDGNGFDVQSFVKKLKNDKTDSIHGRGIVLAQSVSDRVVFNKKGNQVSLIFKRKESIEHEAPLGFAEEEVMNVSKGDILLRAGEFADCLYYVCSGSFTVYHKETAVGRITAADIFMGEMAFLLNNTRSATVIAREPGKVIKVPRKSFITVIKQYPQYSIFLSKLLAQKLVRANELSRSQLIKTTSCD